MFATLRPWDCPDEFNLTEVMKISVDSGKAYSKELQATGSLNSNTPNSKLNKSSKNKVLIFV
jgi:hypothetical protein